EPLDSWSGALLAPLPECRVRERRLWSPALCASGAGHDRVYAIEGSVYNALAREVQHPPQRARGARLGSRHSPLTVMPVTVTVNSPETVAHVSSGGTCRTQVDVCKAPSPGGPVPTPYPNIAMTEQASGGTEHVKCEGPSLLTKGSKVSMSAGDEAGSMGGLRFNTSKGSAEPANYSFDVKFQGKNVV